MSVGLMFLTILTADPGLPAPIRSGGGDQATMLEGR
jgi:hypothetical protein